MHVVYLLAANPVRQFWSRSGEPVALLVFRANVTTEPSVGAGNNQSEKEAMPLLITEGEVKEMLSIADAVPVIEESFLMAGQGMAECPARFRMPLEIGHLQFGPAALHPKKVVGFKLSAYLGARVAGQGFGRRWNYLFSLETGELVAVIQAYAISMMRTASASAVAVKYLSPPTAETLGLIGAGPQAAAQLEAICAVRPVKTVYVFSRTKENREAFCRDAEQRLGVRAVPVSQAEDVVEPADIIVTMTNSTVPVLFGEWIKRPVTVVAAGANHWYKREIDPKVVEGAGLVVVDDKETAKVEGGALLWSAAHGRLVWERVANLGAVVAGGVPLPAFDEGTILFCSHGLALEDVAISVTAYDRARATGKGREIEF
jgi:alanine dehydrogenase